MSRAKIGLTPFEWRALRELGRSAPRTCVLDATEARALVAAGLVRFASADDERQVHAKTLRCEITPRGAEVYSELHEALKAEGSLEA